MPPSGGGSAIKAPVAGAALALDPARCRASALRFSWAESIAQLARHLETHRVGAVRAAIPRRVRQETSNAFSGSVEGEGR